MNALAISLLRLVGIGYVPLKPKKTIQVGYGAIFGIRPLKPIYNIPPDALKVKIRLRAQNIGMAYLKFHDRVEAWTLAPRGGQNINAAEWEIWNLRAVNFTRRPLPAAAALEVKERIESFNRYP